MSDRTPRENAYFFVDRDELIRQLEAERARADDLERRLAEVKARGNRAD